jgi:membrane-associated phospholipid phosphatase|tara:strand:- start:555 stop:1211 length:657 start_codon:yes stop_codon:yes gene_type:complete
MKLFSKAISIIFHPIFTAIYSYLIYFNIQNIYNQMLFLAAPKIYWALLFFLFLMAAFFPLITIYIMYRNKSISSISIPIRKERLPVLILISIYYLMTYYIFRYWNSTLLNLFHPYLSFLFAGLVLILTLTVITYWWKISLHSSSISALCGGMMAETLIAQPVASQSQVLYINMALLVLVGIVSFSRLYLKAHSLSQTIAGIVLGFTLAFSLVFFQIYI